MKKRNTGGRLNTGGRFYCVTMYGNSYIDSSGDVFFEPISLGAYFVFGGEFTVRVNLTELERRNNY